MPERINVRHFWRWCVSGEAFRVKPVVRKFRYICSGGEIGFSRRVKSAYPAPAQRIRRGVTVQQVTIEEIGAQLPRQLQREYPDARKPHASVVVEIAGALKLVCPGIETIETGVAGDSALIALPDISATFKVVEHS